MSEEESIVNQKLGMVVYGVGIAGKVRIRDLRDPDYNDGDWKFIGFVSRRTLHIEGVQQLTEEEALSHPDVHAILVCSEPARHEDIVRKALLHGKHVLVEFPVATSAAATRELYTLAKEKGLLLHEENIALLTPGFADIKEKLKKSTSPVVKGEIKLVGNYNGWAEDFQKSGGPFCVGVSLIQTLYKLFGEDLRATGGTLEVNDKGITAVAKLCSSKCSKLSLTVRRTKERVKRDKTFLFEFENGHVMVEKPEGLPTAPKTENGPQPKKIGLFMRDFLFFISEIKQKRDPSKDIQRAIHCMEVADDIHRFMGLTQAL